MGCTYHCACVDDLRFRLGSVERKLGFGTGEQVFDRERLLHELQKYYLTHPEEVEELISESRCSD